MSDTAPNPYASPESSFESSPVDDKLRRPVGTIVIAVVLLLLGLLVASAGILKGSRVQWSVVSLRFLLRYVFLAVMAPLAAIGASMGLFSGRRLGWWLAMLGYYFFVASFVVLPLVNVGIAQRAVSSSIAMAILLPWWLYVNRPSVLAYFRFTDAPSWRAHVALLVLSLAMVLGVGVW